MQLISKIILAALVAAMFSAGCQSQKVGGQAEVDWCIVVPRASSAQETEAASLLAKFIQQASGSLLPVMREDEAPSSGRLLVGNTSAGMAYAGALGIDFAELGEDGFAIHSVQDDVVFVAGVADPYPTEPLGIVYAASHFLETQLGIRFWAPGVMQVPTTAGFRVPHDLAITQSPPIWFRQVNYGPANDLAYRRWHKLDRVQEEIGRLWAPRWVHSAFHHLSPEDYFESNPEYFCLIGNKRTPSQLCLSNPQVFEIVAQSFEQTFAEHPDVRYISFSQEDNYDACTCKPCAKIDSREGSQMGSLLEFVNALADRFPERMISTLAYQYSRKPPRTLKPRPNVSIMLCTIEEDRARPITANPNSSFPAHMKGWSKIADDIFLWDYEVQFASPVAPFPNLRTLAPNVRWFADNGVRHVFLQGNGLRTEFAEIRCYLLAKLAWDPTVDVEALIDEFLTGYYGPAAPHLRAYIDLLHDAVEKSGEELVLYGNPALAKDSWLRFSTLGNARKIFNLAEAAVADDPTLAVRVRTARLPLMYAELEIAKRRGAGAGGIWRQERDGGTEVEPSFKLIPRPEIQQLLNEFIAGCEAVGIRKLREYDLTLDVYRANWQRLLDPALPNHAAYGAFVQATPSPSPQYADGDVLCLTDGLPGGRPGNAPVTRAYGENWVGWMGTDAVITLMPKRPLHSVTKLSFHALQEPKSWIWLPKSIRVEVQDADYKWHEVATLAHNVDEHANLARLFEVTLPKGLSPSALRLTVEGTKTCPSWHLGAGQPSWFFLDELRVD